MELIRKDKRGQSAMGRSSHPWRTVEAGVRANGSHSCEVRGAPSETSDMNRVPVPGKVSSTLPFVAPGPFSEIGDSC